VQLAQFTDKRKGKGNIMQLGKFDSDRDSALHYLCSSDWGNESFGDSSTWGKYVWRISNTWEEVKPGNTEIAWIIEEFLNAEDLKDSEEFRKSLVGHFLVQEDSNGLVHVREYASEYGLLEDYSTLEQEFSEWNSQDDEEQEG
jgi:hypothetical protein